MPLNADILRTVKGDKRVFVETGTYKGDGCMEALYAGFHVILSVDIDTPDEPLGLPQVTHTLWRGDSAVTLGPMLERVTEPAVFWLDAHTDTESPILAELAQIAAHPIKTHTILIDDMRLFRNGKLQPTPDRIIELLHQINPNYNLDLIDSPKFKRDILVAEVLDD